MMECMSKNLVSVGAKVYWKSSGLDMYGRVVGATADGHVQIARHGDVYWIPRHRVHAAGR